MHIHICCKIFLVPQPLPAEAKTKFHQSHFFQTLGFYCFTKTIKVYIFPENPAFYLTHVYSKVWTTFGVSDRYFITANYITELKWSSEWASGLYIVDYSTWQALVSMRNEQDLGEVPLEVG